MDDIKKDDLKKIIAHQKETDKKLEALSKENKELRGLASQKGIKKLKEITERYAFVRMVDDLVVIGFKNIGSDRKPRYIYDKQDPNDLNNNISYVDIILEPDSKGEEKVITVKYDDFLEESEKVKAKITNVIEKNWETDQGETTKKEVSGYSMVEMNFTVDLKVKGITREYTLELPEEFNNKIITVSENYLNI